MKFWMFALLMAAITLPRARKELALFYSFVWLAMAMVAGYFLV